MLEAQRRLDLLEYVSRLLEDGSFSSTYKLALLHALVDLSGETIGCDSNAAADSLDVRRLATRVIELYWHQTETYVQPVEGNGAVLKQNGGTQAAVLVSIAKIKLQSGKRLAVAQMLPAWKQLVSTVSATLWSMPIKYLQNIQSDCVDRLYPFPQRRGPKLIMHPGVVADLAALAPMLRPMIRNAWSARVQRLNPKLTEHADSLNQFLFGTSRSSLAPWRPLLEELQAGHCFYCGGTLRKGFPVDHFIPWSQYTVDLGENLLGACTSCNSRKSDFLAGANHFCRWVGRNLANAADIADFAHHAGVLSDGRRAQQIAVSAYATTERRQSLVWITGRDYGRLDGSWRSCIRAA